MEKITHFNLPENTNLLFEQEALSSIHLTREVADKINEIIDKCNELENWNYEKHQEQDGKIRAGVVFMKDNLQNSLNDLLVLLKNSGFIDKRIEYYCNYLKERVDNLLSSPSDIGELTDLRVDVDGVGHNTAGTSIRSSFNNLFGYIKNKYLDSVGFYTMFSNISWEGNDAYNRIANRDLINLDTDIKVTAPHFYEVSITVWNEGSMVHDSGWKDSLVIPRGFDVRLCIRRKDDTEVKVGDIYKCKFEEDTFEGIISFENLSYTSGGAYSPIRLNSGLISLSKMVELKAPEGYSVALRLYKQIGEKLNVYKDTGWTNSVTAPIGYICELNFKKNDDSQIFKSDLNNFVIREGIWNNDYFSIVNVSLLKDIMNSVTYGGWTTNGYYYNDTTFTRMVSGIFISDKELKIKSSNPDCKIALHLWSNNQLGTGSYLSASGWQSECVIPANRYFTLYFSGSSANSIMQMSELEVYTLTEYSADKPVVGVSMEHANIKSIAHRGYNLDAPENTLSAFRSAFNKGFKYVECDVSFTSDNVPVILHDSTIDRTSNGSGNIADMTFAEVRQYDFGSWFGNKFIGEVIPSFEEFILLCRNLGLHPYIEIKYGATESQIGSLVSIVQKYGMHGKVTYISFELAYLKTVLKGDGSARLGYIVDNFSMDTLMPANEIQNAYNEVFIDCNYANVTQESGEMCRSIGFGLEVWTINDETIIKNIDPYVSGFTSDYLHAGNILMNM